MPKSVKALYLIVSTSKLLNRTATAVAPDEIGSNHIQGVIDRMLELAAGKGHGKADTRQMVGLAAPQIGISKRIILIDIIADGSKQEQHLHAFIHPRIAHYSDEYVPGREGCWSTGNICGNVLRAKTVALEALDRNGKFMQVVLDGFVARIAQHETDHLNGIRFPDRIPADQPDKLHWVEPAQFEEYRTQWATWPIQCPRARWLTMKAGYRKAT